jgi:hypothetical protein
MIADPEGPSFIVRTVGRRRYSDGVFVTHDPLRTSVARNHRGAVFFHSLRHSLHDLFVRFRKMPLHEAADEAHCHPITGLPDTLDRAPS